MLRHIMAAIVDSVEDKIEDKKDIKRVKSTELYESIKELVKKLNQLTEEEWIDNPDLIMDILEEEYLNIVNEGSIEFDIDEKNSWVNALLYYKGSYVMKFTIQYTSIARIDETIYDEIEKITNSSVRQNIVRVEKIEDFQEENSNEVPYQVTIQEYDQTYIVWENNKGEEELIRIPRLIVDYSDKKFKEDMVNGIAVNSIIDTNMRGDITFFVDPIYKTRYKLMWTSLPGSQIKYYAETIDSEIINIVDKDGKYVEDQDLYAELQDIFYDKIDNDPEWKKLKIYNLPQGGLSKLYEPAKDTNGYEFVD